MISFCIKRVPSISIAIDSAGIENIGVGIL